jgi:hypothetical protein
MHAYGSARSAGRGRLLAIPVLSVLIVAVAIGAASRAAGPGPTSTDPQASMDAATVVLTLLGMALALSLLYLAWSLYTGDRPGNRAPSEKPPAASLRTQLLVALLVLAALGGILALLLTSTPAAQRHRAAGAASSTGLRLPPSTPLAYSTTVGGITAGVVLFVLLALLAAWQLRRLRRRGRGQPFLTELDGPEAPGPWGGADEIRLSLEDVTVPDPLSEPDARRAVIAAWLSMTDAIAAQWRRRDPSETPFEYVGAALAGAGVEAASAHRLTSLFETARYGGLQVGEDMRTEAVAVLDGVRSDLERRAALAASR